MNNSKKLNALVGIALAKDAGEKERYMQQLEEAVSQRAAGPVSGGAEGLSGICSLNWAARRI